MNGRSASCIHRMELALRPFSLRARSPTGQVMVTRPVLLSIFAPANWSTVGVCRRPGFSTSSRSSARRSVAAFLYPSIVV